MVLFEIFDDAAFRHMGTIGGGWALSGTAEELFSGLVLS
jgi:hypothetical protein